MFNVHALNVFQGDKIHIKTKTRAKAPHPALLMAGCVANMEPAAWRKPISFSPLSSLLPFLYFILSLIKLYCPSLDSFWEMGKGHRDLPSTRYYGFVVICFQLFLQAGYHVSWSQLHLYWTIAISHEVTQLKWYLLCIMWLFTLCGRLWTPPALCMYSDLYLEDGGFCCAGCSVL